MSPIRPPLLCSVLSAALIAACSPYDPDLGPTPFRCASEQPRCPSGYECVEGQGPALCVADGTDVTGNPDAGADRADAGPLTCNDDSPIEPNEDIGAATTTPIPDTDDQYKLPAIAICPGTDIDVFRFRIDVANRNITAKLINTNRQRGELILEVLNSTGVMIATAQYQSDTTAVAEVANAATGVYYVRVRAASGTENNYGVEIITAD